jgi:hypothetical protein
MTPVRLSFSTFAPENTPMLFEYQYNYIRFDFLSLHSIIPEAIIPPFQYSTIPSGA